MAFDVWLWITFGFLLYWVQVRVYYSGRKTQLPNLLRRFVSRNCSRITKGTCLRLCPLRPVKKKHFRMDVRVAKTFLNDTTCKWTRNVDDQAMHAFALKMAEILPLLSFGKLNFIVSPLQGISSFVNIKVHACVLEKTYLGTHAWVTMT